MSFKYFFVGLILVLPILAGCSEKFDAHFNLAEIRQGIVAPEDQSAALEEGEDISNISEEKIKTVPIRDINTRINGKNPYLKKMLAGYAEVGDEGSVPGEGVLLNFDNADIYEVIQVIAEILDISYIIDPKVKGVVNIRSGKKIPMSQLKAVFRKLLNINGLDIRSEGEYNYIYMTKKPGSHLIYGPEAASKLKDSPKFIIQVIPVMHLAASEAKKLLDPYVSEQGRIEILDNPNTLFITDYESKVVDVLMILARLDISPMAALKVRLVKVEKAPLFDVKDELANILTALQVNKKGYEGVTVLAMERGNGLLLISSNQELLDAATRWVTELDVVPTAGRDNIYIYNVRNSVASELSDLVNELIGDQPGGGTRTAVTKKTATTKDKTGKTVTSKPVPRVRKTGSTKKKGDDGGGLRWAGEPTLIADDSRNIILIRALPADYSRLTKLLERLDNMPRQVLIEVLVAEVTLSDRWEMGIEWNMNQLNPITIGSETYDNYLTSNTSQIPNSAGSTYNDLLTTGAGLTYSILDSAGQAVGILNAIADNNELSILSSPQIMVLNNETATVNVGEQVPIVTNQTGSLDSNNLNQSIEYKDTGVILKVTPRINYDGIIILEINQQVSSAQELVTEGLLSPTITTREIDTKLALKDGQTIFMGGLIANITNTVDTGVPWLKDIPLLGWLFKYQKEQVDKKELLMMITPYVIESEDALDQYARSFGAKMDELRKKLHGDKVDKADKADKDNSDED